MKILRISGLTGQGSLQKAPFATQTSSRPLSKPLLVQERKPVFFHHVSDPAESIGSTVQKKQKIRVYIRWMIRRDMPEVLRIEQTSYKYPWNEKDFLACLRHRNCIGLVAEQGEKVVGFMIYELHKKMIHVLNLAVHSESYRRGIGTQMAEKLVSKLSSHKRTRIVMEVSDTNGSAKKFLEKVGFNPPSKPHNFPELEKYTSIIPGLNEYMPTTMEYVLKGTTEEAEDGNPDQLSDVLTPLDSFMLANSPQKILKVINNDDDGLNLDTSLRRTHSPYKSLATILETFNGTPPLGFTYLRASKGDEKAFVNLAFRLLHSEECLELFAPILKRIESFMDGEASESKKKEVPASKEKKKRLHHLPNLPELFLILNNLRVHKKGNEHLVDPVTSCITSIDRFAPFGLDVDYRLVQVWAKIGFLTHAFKFWKYDTQGGENSLFSKFGFKFDSKASKDFGARYIISKQERPELTIDDKTIITPIRGGIVITTRWGTVFIRNSSLVFGRDLLLEPAYFSEDPLTLEEIKSIDSKDDLDRLHFKNILEPTLYQDKNFVSNLKTILGEMLIVKKAYAKWRFDPDGFLGEDENFRGDLTLGMRELVHQMENRLGEIALGMSNKLLPVLGIFPSEYPPENPFKFYSVDGTPYNYLELTEKMLAEMKDRLNGTWTKEKYPNSMWRQFVQSAVDHHDAEMVLIDRPKKD